MQYETWPLGKDAYSHYEKNIFNFNTTPLKIVSNSHETAEEFAKRYDIDHSRVNVETFVHYEQPFHGQRTFVVEPAPSCQDACGINSGSGYYDLLANSYESFKASFAPTKNPSPNKSLFDPFKITASFKDLNKNTDHTHYFGNQVLDSFISGKYSSFNNLQGSLFEPFTDWRGKYTPSGDVMDKLNNLKLFGFSTTYNPLAPTEYISSFDQFKQQNEPNSYARSFSNDFFNTQKDYINKQFKTDYSWQQQKATNPSHHSDHWHQSISNFGRNVKYTAPTGGLSIQIGISRPIAIDLKNDGIKFVNFNESSIFFDTNDDGYLENVSWIDKEDGILFYDSNDDGIISEASEVILTKLDDDAKTDFDVLKNKFDSNNDNIIDKNDDEFEKLKIWQDKNQNGISEPNEVMTLQSIGLNSISLEFTIPEEQFAKDNFVTNLAHAKMQNGNSTTIYDWGMVHSKHGVKFNQTDSTVTINFQNGQSEFVYDADKLTPLLLKLDSSKNDLIIATDFNDKISIKDHTGAVVDLGGGDDEVYLETGNNWVKGGAGIDKIKTGGGHDILFIDADDDMIDAGDGHDVAFVSDPRSIKLNLNNSNLEAVYANSGNDHLEGSGSKSVTLRGNAGDDVLIGSDNDDIIVGGPGKDIIKAGKGNDFIFIDEDDPLSEIDAGEGEDTIIIESEKGLTLDLDSLNAEIGYGGFGNDIITATGSKDYVLYGDAGDDELQGGSLKTVLDGGIGNDTLKGGSGNNRYVFSSDSGHDVIHSQGTNRGEFKDYVLLSSSIELKDLSFEKNNDDLLMKYKDGESSLRISKWFLGDAHKVNGFIYRADDTNNSQNIILIEEPGEVKLNDKNNWIIYTLNNKLHITGNSGSEFIKFGNGDNFFISDGGKDIAYGGEGNDVLHAWSKKELDSTDGLKFYGGNGDDVLIGSMGDDVLDGGKGNDIVAGSGGNDVIYTGGGDINSLSECDRADGDAGDDTIYLQGTGAKRISGGPGNDKFIIEPNNFKNHAIYTIIDFEVGNPEEIIDFSQAQHIRSRSDLTSSDTKVQIDISLRGNLESKAIGSIAGQKNHVVDATSLCWKDNDADEVVHCVYLANVTKEMLVKADDAGQFLYSEV